MAKPDAVFIYIGTYPDEAAARADYDVVKDLHAAGAVGTYDAAVVTKDDAGKVHVNKDEMATRHGAWGGAAVGAVVGILFPPAIIGTAVVGAAVGGVGGHLWRGMSRADVKEFGEHHRRRAGGPGHRRREHAGAGRGQGRAEGREARRQGTRREREGRRQGRPGSRHRSQLNAVA